MKRPVPRRAQGRPAVGQARPVGRVRRLPRLHPRRRPPPARLERPGAPREAVHQAVRRGGGRHDPLPPRRLGVDGRRRPAEAAVREARRGALGYIGLASGGPGRGDGARRAARRAGGRSRCAAPAASSGCSPPSRGSRPRTADRPRRRRAPRRRAAAGRGVIVCSPTSSTPADRVIRELAATGSELIVLHVLSPEELDPSLEGDVRLVDVETGDGLDVTVDLATIDDYKARLAAWQEGFADLAAQRGATYVPISTDLPLADLVFAELRRRRAGLCCRWRPAHEASCPLAAGAARPAVRAARARDVPAQAAARRAVVPVDAAVAAAADRRRGERALAEAAPEPPAAAPAPARRAARDPRRAAVPGAAAGLAGDVVVVIDTSASMAATDVPPTASPRPSARSSRPSRELPANGTVSVIAAGRTARVVVNGTTDLGRSAPPSRASPSRRDRRPRRRPDPRRRPRRARATPRSSSPPTPRSRSSRRRSVHEVRSSRSGRERRNQAIVALAVRPAPRA